jgi:hypothetical protein
MPAVMQDKYLVNAVALMRTNKRIALQLAKQVVLV